MILAMAIGITCFAAESNFSDEKIFVDSNQYTYITSAVKDNANSTPEVKITAIYDANKNAAKKFAAINGFVSESIFINRPRKIPSSIHTLTILNSMHSRKKTNSVFFI